MRQIPHNIIISRTDNIGDVVLTLPVAAVLKKHFPDIKIAFLGKAYTKPAIDTCIYIDEFIDVDDFTRSRVTILGRPPEAILHLFPDPALARRAKQLRIPLRIGTSHRLYHWLTCNELVFFSRRKSSLHEAQLNLKLLEPLGITDILSLEELGHLFGMQKHHLLFPRISSLVDRGKYNIIFHPKSKGSAREWGLDNFIRLIRLLDPERYHIFISGTAKERPLLQPIFDSVGDRVTDITGLMPLEEFISFIWICDGLVANSTGPLHIAGALGKDAFGIYPAIRPIHPGRWAPLGPRAHAFSENKTCIDCKGNKQPCHCIADIPPALIKIKIDEAAAAKRL